MVENKKAIILIRQAKTAFPAGEPKLMSQLYKVHRFIVYKSIYEKI